MFQQEAILIIAPLCIPIAFSGKFLIRCKR